MVPVISLRNDIKVIFNCQNLQSLHLHLSLISNSWHLLAEYHKLVQNLPTWLRGSRKPFHHFIKFCKGQFSLNLRLCFCNQLFFSWHHISNISSSDLVLWRWEVCVEQKEQWGDLTGLKFGGSRFFDPLLIFILAGFLDLLSNKYHLTLAFNT